MQDARQGVKITELISADLARLTHFAILNNLNGEQTNLSPGGYTLEILNCPDIILPVLRISMYERDPQKTVF
jgi:hypothetical protein